MWIVQCLLQFPSSLLSLRGASSVQPMCTFWAPPCTVISSNMIPNPANPPPSARTSSTVVVTGAKWMEFAVGMSLMSSLRTENTSPYRTITSPVAGLVTSSSFSRFIVHLILFFIFSAKRQWGFPCLSPLLHSGWRDLKASMRVLSVGQSGEKIKLKPSHMGFTSQWAV